MLVLLTSSVLSVGNRWSIWSLTHCCSFLPFAFADCGFKLHYLSFLYPCLRYVYPSVTIIFRHCGRNTYSIFCFTNQKTYSMTKIYFCFDFVFPSCVGNCIDPLDVDNFGGFQISSDCLLIHNNCPFSSTLASSPL